MRILHITDIHGDVEALEKVVDYAVETEPEVLACTGDYLGFLLSRKQTHEMHKAFLTIRQGVKKGFSINDEMLDHLSKFPKTPKEMREAVETYKGIEKVFDERAEKQYAEMAGILGKFKGTFFSVPGNWDTMKYFENPFFRQGHLHGRHLMSGDFKFAGVGLSGEAPIFTPPTRVEHVGDVELYHRLMNEEPEADVVLTHMPPYGLQDGVIIGAKKIAHGGSFAHLAYIRTKQPSLVLCGHYHDNFGPTKDIPSGTIVVNSGNLGEYKGSVKQGTFNEIEIGEKKYVTLCRGYQIIKGKIEEITKVAIQN